MDRRARGGSRTRFVVDCGDLVDPTLMASAFEPRREKDVENFVGKARRNDPTADRQHVRVVVFAGHASGVEIVAERGAHAAHLVGRNLFALTTPAEHDPAVGRARCDAASNGGADRWVVDAGFGVGAEIVDLVSALTERADEVGLQLVSRMVGPDGDAHGSLLRLGA